ncbi:unnamed protein product [Phaedon cochleariae]|uniref:Acyltransferase 3 domain-containing protein n=1 Tax=Phaedon cochleariae TaxID=80249 RepID=A0A9P0GNC5_PHACE|nr:unnamed protein product [Phaedon cochleariae]
MLPKLFQMDDYKECLKNDNTFCKVNAHLQPKNAGNEIWKSIQDSLKNQDHFDHSILHRGYCLNSQEARDVESVKRYSEYLTNREITNTNLTATIEVLACTDSHLTISSFDILFIIIVVIYGIFISIATYEDIRRKKTGNASLGFYKQFSLYQSWKKRVIPLKNDDSKKLKSIQGIRTYNFLLIVLVHTKMGFLFHYVENPDWVEEVKPLWHLLFTLYMFIVYTFTLISSWLLTNQVLESFQKHEHFSLKHAGIMVVHRYFRMAVTYLTCVAMFNTSLVRNISGALNIESTFSHEVACKKGWFYSLLLINNFQYMRDLCNGISWYIGADFQLYCLNIIVLYVILKYKLNFTKVLALLVAFSTVVYAIIIYIYDMDIIFRLYTRNIELRKFLNSFSFIVSYSSTYSMMNASFVGVIFGVIYFRNKHQQFNIKWKLQCLWASLFFGLPTLAVLLASNEARGLSAIILGPIVKPLFVTGIGVGILGMSHGIGGIVKRICEWEVAVIVGNFSYCLYLFQLPAVVYQTALTNYPLRIGYSRIVFDYIVAVMISFVFGGAMTLLVEEPGITLQKMWLPQLRKSPGVKIKEENGTSVSTNKSD